MCSRIISGQQTGYKHRAHILCFGRPTTTGLNFGIIVGIGTDFLRSIRGVKFPNMHPHPPRFLLVPLVGEKNLTFCRYYCVFQRSISVQCGRCNINGLNHNANFDAVGFGPCIGTFPLSFRTTPRTVEGWGWKAFWHSAYHMISHTFYSACPANASVVQIGKHTLLRVMQCILF